MNQREGGNVPITKEELGRFDAEVAEIRKDLEEGRITFKRAMRVSRIRKKTGGGNKGNSNPVLNPQNGGAANRPGSRRRLFVGKPKGMEIYEEDQIASRVTDLSVCQPKSISLYLSPKQGAKIIGLDLREELAGQRVAGSELADLYLQRPGLIPSDWKPKNRHQKKRFLFWGTIFRHRAVLYVKFIFYNTEAPDKKDWFWDSGLLWLDQKLSANDPAVIIEEPKI